MIEIKDIKSDSGNIKRFILKSEKLTVSVADILRPFFGRGSRQKRKSISGLCRFVSGSGGAVGRGE